MIIIIIIMIIVIVIIIIILAKENVLNTNPTTTNVINSIALSYSQNTNMSCMNTVWQH